LSLAVPVVLLLVLVFGVFSASNNYFHICPIYRLGFRKTDKNMKPTVKNQKQKSTTHNSLSKVKATATASPTANRLNSSYLIPQCPKINNNTQ
jgi:zona occludens toxin (predicted ATPase)